MFSGVRILVVPNAAPDSDLLRLLGDVARMARTLADRRARAHGMTRAQWLILAWLRRCPGLTQRALAAQLEVEPITIGRLVDRLAVRGLVERRADAADRRVWRLHLTDAALPVLEEIDALRRGFEAEVTSGLDAASHRAAAAALLTMKSNLVASLEGAADPAAPRDALAA